MNFTALETHPQALRSGAALPHGGCLHRALWACSTELGAALATLVQPAWAHAQPPIAGPWVCAFQLDLQALDLALQGRALAALPGVPTAATRSRQLSFVAGRLCAEAALQMAGATPPFEVQKGVTGQPLWPQGWTGSITHTRHRAVAVATQRQGSFDPGLDVEQLIVGNTRTAVLQMCVHESERHLLASATQPELALTVLFSAKEAYYKAVYGAVRRFIDFKEVALSDWQPQAGSFSIGPAPACAPPTLPAPELQPVPSVDWPSVRGWFLQQGEEVTTAVAPGYAGG